MKGPCREPGRVARVLVVSGVAAQPAVPDTLLVPADPGVTQHDTSLGWDSSPTYLHEGHPECSHRHFGLRLS